MMSVTVSESLTCLWVIVLSTLWLLLYQELKRRALERKVRWLHFVAVQLSKPSAVGTTESPEGAGVQSKAPSARCVQPASR